MANRVQHLRHTVTALANFTGLSAEVTVNLANNTIVVHDGITPGGYEHALASLLNVNAATTSVPGKMTDQHVRDLILALANSISNAADIADNTNSILLNISAISNNATAIAQNASDISTLSGGQGAYLLLSGGQMSGSLLLAADPVSNTEPATKSYTDTGDAAAEANAISHANGLAATLQASKANRAGDTFSGPVILSADPVTAMEAATKQYVDVEIAAAVATSTTVLVPGVIPHGFISLTFPPQESSDGIKRVCVAIMPLAGKYTVKYQLQTVSSGAVGYDFRAYVYKNGVATGQEVNESEIVLNNDPQTFSFDVAINFEIGDTLDIRIRNNSSGAGAFTVLNMGLFAVQKMEPVVILPGDAAEGFGM